MMVYVVVGAVLLGYIAYLIPAERRRRWRARMMAPSPTALDGGDPIPPPVFDAGGDEHHQHHDHHHDHGGHHGTDFDIGGSGHHH